MYRDEVEQKVYSSLAASGDKDEWLGLRGAGASVVASIIRFTPSMDDSGEHLVKLFRNAGIRVSPEQAMQLHAALSNQLRAKLGTEHFIIMLNPHEQLAYAIADGLKKLAKHKPLLVFLDTYEIVDRADNWLRIVLQEAGSHLVWVIAGRDNLLKSRQYGPNDYFTGYADDFPRRLVSYDMRQLAKEDIASYFNARIPERPLTPSALSEISRVTRGIPLAIREAADIWAVGQPLSEIVNHVPDGTPSNQIVQRMTDRYLLHCVNNESDRRALYALALARGDEDLLRVMLDPKMNLITRNISIEEHQAIQVDINSLHNTIVMRFDEQELRTLCLYLNIDYDNLPAIGKEGKVTELIRYCERHTLIDNLVKQCQEQRTLFIPPKKIKIHLSKARLQLTTFPLISRPFSEN